MTARNLSIPKRTPATQSRPMENVAAGGMSARPVGSPAGGRRTAAMFSSLGVAATNSILARDRHRDNGEVRRLGFAPIPGRRFNSNVSRPALARRTGPVVQRKGNDAPDRLRNPGASRGERAATLSRVAGSGDRIAVHREAGERTSQKRFEIWPAGVAPGRARIISATRRDTCRGCGGRKEWCDCRERTACERARGSTDPRRPSVEACRARNSFSRMISRLIRAGRYTPDLDIRPAPFSIASGDALYMARVGHNGIDAACKNLDGR